MIVGEIQSIVEGWAPKEIAWEKDNVGLQIGRQNKNIHRILVTLDVTESIAEEAHRKRIDLIISHHPAIFHPLANICETDRVGRIATKLIKYDIALLVAHTNIDFVYSGVSFTLAKKLGLKKIDFLLKDYRIDKKIVVFVPRDYAEKVQRAMSDAGAGQIGKYEMCSFHIEGTGTFKGRSDSKPFVGKKGKLEKVPEIRLEMVFPERKLHDILEAMRSTHPYEEIAFDIYNLENISLNYGNGAIGEMNAEVSLKKFLPTLSRILRIPALRYSGKAEHKIKRVAVCGGSGSDLIQAAIRSKADVFITGDISYHKFQDGADKIVLIDAGHFETEFPIVGEIAKYLKNECKKLNEKIDVFTSNRLYNQVKYYTT